MADARPTTPEGAMKRLALFGDWTNTTPPARILDEDRAFSDEILTYARRTGLSLDWFWLGDERGLVMQAHRAATGVPA